MRPIKGTSSMYLHQDMLRFTHNNRFPFIKEEFCVFHIIKEHKYKLSFLEQEPDNYNNLYIDLYGFFFVSDVMRLFHGSWSQLIEDRICGKKLSHGSIAHGKRLYCFKVIKNKDLTNKCLLYHL
uniref:Uncharacterized protein n=1 Tax=Cliftonaea pectinata TaxID=2007206 RepID=A0A1Z1MQH8_9FLOR|nr:hypothetical protein [Cliftonaea pectinata]ARW68112.1 hypothetical protein [Cliftonaea pectinata]